MGRWTRSRQRAVGARALGAMRRRSARACGHGDARRRARRWGARAGGCSARRSCIQRSLGAWRRRQHCQRTATPQARKRAPSRSLVLLSAEARRNARQKGAARGARLPGHSCGEQSSKQRALRGRTRAICGASARERPIEALLCRWRAAGGRAAAVHASCVRARPGCLARAPPARQGLPRARTIALRGAAAHRAAAWERRARTLRRDASAASCASACASYSACRAPLFGS